MTDTPTDATIIADLTDIIFSACQGILYRDDARDVAENILDWLGGHDPDADAGLIVWHLREGRKRIAELEAELARYEPIDAVATPPHVYLRHMNPNYEWDNRP